MCRFEDLGHIILLKSSEEKKFREQIVGFILHHIYPINEKNYLGKEFVTLTSIL